MFDRFNDDARKTVVLAQEYARMLRHATVTPEHMVLGAIHHADSRSAQYLKDRGVNVDAFRERVKSVIGSGPGESNGHIPFTDTARRAMFLAETARTEAGQDWLGDLQILGALSTVKAGPLRTVFEEFGINNLDVAGQEAPEPTRGFALAG